jgi:Fe2+ or Zn2+ uptake regulation protein
MSELTEDACQLRIKLAEEYWKAKGSRVTFIRQILCNLIFRTSLPFEAEWLLKEARKSDKLISMTSVYRTLKDLRHADLVEPHLNKTNKGLYQLTPNNQTANVYIRCKNCGKTILIDDPCLPLREGAQAHRMGFKATHVSLQTEATYDEFESTGSCTRPCIFE